MVQVMYAGAQTQLALLDTRGLQPGHSPRTTRKVKEMSDKRLWSPPQIIWSALIAIFVWTAVGFSWFGYGFDWSTQIGASRMSNQAVVENLAAICVAQARRSPNSEAALKELAAMQNWKRRGFIEEERWAVMPGSDSEQSGVADLCAEKLLAT